MFHLGAFSFSSTNTGAGVFITMPAIADQFLTVNANNRFILPQPPTGGPSPWRIAAGYAQGTTLTVARVNNATLRATGLPSITPIQPALVIGSAFQPCVYGINGPKLPFADEFGIEADAAAIERQTGCLWIHDGVQNNAASNPNAQIFSLQFASTITTVANTWTAGNITFNQTLPVGRYQVVGMDVIGTTLIFARLIFPFGGPRPGVLGRATSAIFPTNTFRNGNFGQFGEFTSYAQPQLEVFASSAAGITFTGNLDMVKVG
jgi:hypothetical protein